MPPSSVMGEVYCFPLYQLIFSFDWFVIYYLKGLWTLRVHSEIGSVRLSVPRSSNEERDFIFILNDLCCTSIYSSQ